MCSSEGLPCGDATSLLHLAVLSLWPLAVGTEERGHKMASDSNILDWLTWPADLLLRAGGFVASWFFSEDATSFAAVQMMFATLVLAAFVSLIVFWQSLLEYWRALWTNR